MFSADFWAGYASGALGIIVGNPLDVIKVRLQAAPRLVPTLPQPTGTTPPLNNATPPTASSSSTRARPNTLRESLRGLPAPVLTYGALNALLFMSYNRTLALFPPTNTNSPTTTNFGSQEHDAAAYKCSYQAHFLAGAVAGLATFIISAPTELVKCRAQMAETRSNPRSTSSWSIFTQTLRTSGLRGLYEGGVITSLRDSVGYGFYFWSYEFSKNIWDSTFTRPPAVNRGAAPEAYGKGYDGTGGAIAALTHSEASKILLCGGIAGVVTWASIFPLDVIKTRVQTQPSLAPSQSAQGESQSLLQQQTVAVKKGAVRIAVEAYKNEGIRVFFRGMTACCVRAFIVNAVQWGSYEWIMRALKVET